jgi:hypothetical protein
MSPAARPEYTKLTTRTPEQTGIMSMVEATAHFQLLDNTHEDFFFA